VPAKIKRAFLKIFSWNIYDLINKITEPTDKQPALSKTQAIYRKTNTASPLPDI